MRLDAIPRYVVVGALCAGLYNAIMLAGAWAHVSDMVSTLFSFVVIVLIGYGAHCLYTFSEAMSWRGLARYTAAMALALPLSLGAIFALHDVGRVPMWFASPAVTALTFGWNYVATHWAVVTRVLAGKKPQPQGRRLS